MMMTHELYAETARPSSAASAAGASEPSGAPQLSLRTAGRNRWGPATFAAPTPSSAPAQPPASSGGGRQFGYPAEMNQDTTPGKIV